MAASRFSSSARWPAVELKSTVLVGLAGVEIDELTVDAVGSFGGEKGEDTRHFFGRRRRGILRFVKVIPGRFGRNGAENDGVGDDAVGLMFAGDRAHEGVDRRLRRAEEPETRLRIA